MTALSADLLSREGVQIRRMYANVFLLSSPQGRVIVDSGALPYAPAYARLLRQFRPDAVLVTHAHVDHAGGAFVAARSGLPVLAHPLEHAQLTGQRHELPYPAGNPQLGAIISRLHPKVPAHALTAVDAGQDVLGWEVLHLPGHSHGQIGLLRNGVLIAADAVLSAPDGRGGMRAALPHAPYNADHAQALQTIKHIADMDLRLILPGHGGPLTPEQVRERAERPT
ncbi:MBL fold metallo-hydrolase [Deinococcus sp. QL22]|uniref:MBL fold metallo-hydrolase n=1 Tax=Deinococcus sp. QL22 TaxID=2939437 RepID=UPI002018131F|nr:MBL fold metallo-hydrolase [Deinococcus sp. QL22]UQN05682.1 MBL fold metallo-hydrolase [Deinococcus sp. QL22]